MSATTTKRASAVNFGDRERVQGRTEKTLAWISVDDSQAFTVYVTADVAAPPAVARNVRAVASIEWGHGGASVSEQFPIARRLRVPLVGSMVRVAVRLVDVTGAVVPDTIAADCAAVIAPGVDAELARNTRWTSTHGAAGIGSVRPELVVGVHGYATSAVARWLMLFDARSAAAPGDTPTLSRPASPQGFDVADVDGRPFYVGVVWGVSSTPLLYTPDPAADVHLELGFLL
jgi:hypothetical protein